MALISGGDLYSAVLTRDVEDAGTKDTLNVSINIDGDDVVSRYTIQRGILPGNQIRRRNAAIVRVPSTLTEPISFDSALLTNSSVRLGINGDDAWAPVDILLLGREAANGRYIPLAGEWNIGDTWLSTDPADASPSARLTIPIRLVPLGNIDTVIRRVSLLVKTSNADDAGTVNPIRLEIIAGGGTPIYLNQVIGDTLQDDRSERSDNWYTMDVTPFNRENLMSDGRIRLSILGDDKWLPRALFLFGLDTAEGRPSEIVPLVSISTDQWNLGWLSEDTTEGQPSVDLPIS